MNTQPVISAKLYSGSYGNTSSNADMLAVSLNVPRIEAPLGKRGIILVVDVSGSMEPSMDIVRASLLAFRDNLVKDLERISLTLITFSNAAKIVWSQASSESFDDAVRNIRTDHSTNMGAGIELAFSSVDLEIPTWIIVMTDGVSNTGMYQRPESFRNLVTTKPKYSQIISLGYGTAFHAETLMSIGAFTYIEDSEKIPIVFGGLSSEILTAIGIHCYIELPLLSTQNIVLNDDDIIPPLQSNNHRTIIGSSDVGTLFSERVFHYVHLPFGDVCGQISHYLGRHVRVRYIDIETRSEVVLKSKFEETLGGLPDDLRSAYFAASKARILSHIWTNASKTEVIEAAKSELTIGHIHFHSNIKKRFYE